MTHSLLEQAFNKMKACYLVSAQILSKHRVTAGFFGEPTLWNHPLITAIDIQHKESGMSLCGVIINITNNEGIRSYHDIEPQ